MSRTATMQPTFPQFFTEFVDNLQRAADTYLEEFNEHHAFNYLVAELFATTKAGHFSFTDGPNDGGVDFFVMEAPSYCVYQCKCSTIETLQGQASAPTFDDQAINVEETWRLADRQGR